MIPAARKAAENFARGSYSSETEAIDALERIIANACRAHANDLATALADAISTFPHDDREVLVTPERQEAWIAVLARHRNA